MIKLGDFGEAAVLESTTEKRYSHAGTNIFMSPEMLDGQSYEYKNDIWSAGCVLYMLCCLKPPF